MPNRHSSEYDADTQGGDYEGTGYGSRLLNNGPIPADILRSQYQTGTHSGKGPKGYIRPDSSILEEIYEILTRDHDVDATDIEVQVESGVVTLAGFVPDRQMKHRSELLAEGCTGVKEVQNQIRVRRENQQ